MTDDSEKIANVSLQQRADLMAEIERLREQVCTLRELREYDRAEIARLRSQK